MTTLPLPQIVLKHHFEDGALRASQQEWLTQQRLPQVLLVTGMPGVGKRSSCHYLSQWILCEKTWPQQTEAQSDQEVEGLFGGMLAQEKPAATSEAGSLKPCGQCGCCQNALKGSWVDFLEITHEDADGESSQDGGALKIDQFRKLKSSTGFSGGFSGGTNNSSGRYRVILIPNADRMTTQAANSVLKLLEEPPAGWIFLLTSSDPSLLLPTIVSRCQQLRLKPFSRAEIDQLLNLEGPAGSAVETAKRALSAEMAQGSWGKALAWMEPENWERRKVLIDFLNQPASELNNLVEWASSSPKNMEKMIDQLETFLADLIRWSISPEKHQWMNADANAPLSMIAKNASSHLAAAREKWINRAERLASARVKLNAPLNRKLLAQDLLMSWLSP